MYLHFIVLFVSEKVKWNANNAEYSIIIINNCVVVIFINKNWSEKTTFNDYSCFR